MRLAEYMDIKCREMDLRAVSPTEEERRAARAYERRLEFAENPQAKLRVVGATGLRDATPDEEARYLDGCQLREVVR